MAARNEFPGANLGRPHARNSMPLDTARTAFEWLVTGPHPVCVDGRLFPGLPNRRLPVHEVRDLLLRRRCPQATRDAVWAHLVLRARTEGSTWTVVCVGVALPALTRIAATLSARFAGDVTDIHAAALTGFITEIAHINLCKPYIMVRLRWAAYRAGRTAVREALDAPVAAGNGFRSAEPTPPWGHPDFVLARAVTNGAITASEAELIGSTRLEGVPLATVAEERGAGYEATKKARLRAEYRLAAYLRHEQPSEPDTASAERDLATQVTAAVPAAATSGRSSRSVTERAEAAGKKSRPRVSPHRSETGVQRHGGDPATPVPPTPAASPSQESRCA